MTTYPELVTERLRLRPWQEADIEPWTRLLYADPDVTRYLPRTSFTPEERTARFYRYIVEHWERHGYGIWALTDRESGAFIGQAGLNYIDDLGEVELDYALAKAYWGKGIASEAARAVTAYGFETLQLPKMIALTFRDNIASRKVMERVGFVYDRDVHVFGADVMLHENTPERFRAAIVSAPPAA